MKVNLNDRIKVKLTDYGKSIHFKFYALVMKNIKLTTIKAIKCFPEIDKEGYTYYQLWEFMHIFGKHLYNGSEQVIEKNEIVFDKKEGL